MQLIDKNKALNYYLIDILYELNLVEERIRFFEKKHDQNFISFSDKVKKSGEEKFEEWDDYVEWKAHIKSKEYLLLQKNEIENGDYKIA